MQPTTSIVQENMKTDANTQSYFKAKKDRFYKREITNYTKNRETIFDFWDLVWLLDR